LLLTITNKSNLRGDHDYHTRGNKRSEVDSLQTSIKTLQSESATWDAKVDKYTEDVDNINVKIDELLLLINSKRKQSQSK
jgi:peptidoglycan hydrolase CwlO-like protein